MWAWGYFLDHEQLHSAHTLEEKLSSPSGRQLPIIPQLGLEC